MLAQERAGYTCWHEAAENGHVDILHKLREWAKKLLTPDELYNKVFLAKVVGKKPVWYMALESGQLEVLH
jgi:hypothetical protein